MNTIRDLLEQGDEIIHTLTERLLNEELSWDEFYDLARARLQEVGKDAHDIDAYERAMRGI